MFWWRHKCLIYFSFPLACGYRFSARERCFWSIFQARLRHTKRRASEKVLTWKYAVWASYLYELLSLWARDVLWVWDINSLTMSFPCMGNPKIFLVVSSPCVTWWWHDWVCVCVCVWKLHVIWQREAVSPFRTPVMVMTYFWKTLNFFPYFWSKAGYHIEVIGCHRRKNKTVMRMKTWQSIYN